MYTGTDLEPYMTAIRDHVCSRCVERPPTGPPCLPLGKRCGIEINLRQLVDAVRGVHSNAMDSYVAAFHHVVCEECPNRTTNQCPCALDSLLLLAVEAIESVEVEQQRPIYARCTRRGSVSKQDSPQPPVRSARGRRY